MVNVFGQDADPKASPPKAPPAKSSAAPGAAVPAEPAPVTTAETLQKLGMPAPRYPAHPPEKKASGGSQVTVPTTPKFVMATPPPALRPETKPAAPAGNYVWVPGHYVPLNDEWRWVAGEWGVPATPSSVWIEAQYDPKTKSWSPGYWHPDRPDPAEPTSPTKAPSDGY